jgi:hypothetical protein
MKFLPYFKSILFYVSIFLFCACGNSKLLSDTEKQSWRQAQATWNKQRVSIEADETPAQNTASRQRQTRALVPKKSPKTTAVARNKSSPAPATQSPRKNINEVATTVDIPQPDDSHAFVHSVLPVENKATKNNKKSRANKDISFHLQGNGSAIAPLAFPQQNKGKKDGSIITAPAPLIIAGIFSAEMWHQCFPDRYGVAATGKNSVNEVGNDDFFSFEAFVRACQHFPDFLNEGDVTLQKRELAAFLAHISIETGDLRFREQLNIQKSYSVQHADYPPVEGKDYHGRGPIQLSYNYNYGQFSKAYFGDKNVLLQRPEMLMEDAAVSFGSAIWFWMTPQPPKPSCHSVIAGIWKPSDADKKNHRLPGFGLTLNIINASQCGENAPVYAQKRYEAYERFCNYLGVDKGENCMCENQVPYGKQ